MAKVRSVTKNVAPTPWSKFLIDVDAARQRLSCKKGEECFYRGHGDNSWSLLPSLLRHCAAAGLKKADDIRDREAELFFEFRSRARALHSQELTDWDVLFHMQHHGAPTRLLDWTEVLGVAVYFALRDSVVGKQPCVWLLNPYSLNEKSWKLRDIITPEHLLDEAEVFSDYLIDYSDNQGFDWDEPVAIYPAQSSARLHAQRGYFTIHGDATKPIDEIWSKNSPVEVVDLPAAALPDALRFLEDAGINEHLLYPDLDGLARYLHLKLRQSGS